VLVSLAVLDNSILAFRDSPATAQKTHYTGLAKKDFAGRLLTSAPGTTSMLQEHTYPACLHACQSVASPAITPPKMALPIIIFRQGLNRTR
jgi:hypothetical protein